VAIPPLAPDPRRGVFETLLVEGGVTVELDAHIARLGASLEELYGGKLPHDLGSRAREHARGFDLGRLRIVVAPAEVTGGAEWRVELAVEAVDRGDVFPGRERAGALETLHRAGGLGRHKWADRRPLETIAAPAVPLLVDRDDEVLEAGRANVFVGRNGALFTPADDGRILPGIARAGAIAAAAEAGIEVTQTRLTADDLFAADEVFLTGSVRGVERAGTLDGAPLPARTALGERVAAGLRRRWRTGRLSATRS
jgi:para-aminobenzoate synthetase/4-amino-4-deoxychorismate lyase